MFLRQIPAVAASVLLGLGLAQVDDAQRGSNTSHPAAQGSSHKTIMPTLNQSSNWQRAKTQGADGGRLNDDAHGVPRSSGGRRWVHQWDMDGEHGGPYGFGGPLIYWAPGRWYPYPGFGDKRFWTPQPEGVWSR
jgi:hypothetical protein